MPLEDTRGLPAPQPQVDLRTDPLTGDVITYATHRNTRTYLPPADQCPLCASKPGNPTEIPDHDYNVAVFENRFPSFAGPGRTEVVCFTSDHNQSFTDLSQGQARLVVDTWADRTAELSARDDVEHVFPFENRGREIGVTLSHPHGQIYAYPFLPPRMRHPDGPGPRAPGGCRQQPVRRCPGRGEEGRHPGRRREHQLDRVRARRRPAGRSRCTCTRTARSPTSASCRVGERDDFAELYLDVLRRLDGLYGDPLPYIAAWHQAPVRIDRELGYLHLEVLSIRRAADKIKYLAGSESGMGAFISDTRPEDVAETLRKVGS